MTDLLYRSDDDAVFVALLTDGHVQIGGPNRGARNYVIVPRDAALEMFRAMSAPTIDGAKPTTSWPPMAHVSAAARTGHPDYHQCPRCELARVSYMNTPVDDEPTTVRHCSGGCGLAAAAGDVYCTGCRDGVERDRQLAPGRDV